MQFFLLLKKALQIADYMPTPGLSTGAEKGVPASSCGNKRQATVLMRCFPVCVGGCAVSWVTACKDAGVSVDHWAGDWWQPVALVWTFLWIDWCTHLFPSLEWFSETDITGVDWEGINIVHLLISTAKIFPKSETVRMLHPICHRHMGQAIPNTVCEQSRQEVINGCKWLDNTERGKTSWSPSLHLQILSPGASCSIC